MQMSPADILDRASILKVKMGKLPNGARLGPEFSDCLFHLRHLDQDRVMHYLHELHHVNARQFVENERLFDDLSAYRVPSYEQALAIIGHVRRAHLFNQRRVEIKNLIAEEFGGSREEKTWNQCAPATA